MGSILAKESRTRLWFSGVMGCLRLSQSRAFNRCAPCDLGRSRGPFVKISAVSLAARRSTIGKAPLAQSDVELLAERRERRRQPVPGSLELASRRWGSALHKSPSHARCLD